ISALSYIRLEDWLSKRHGKVRLDTADTDQGNFGKALDGGVRVYLADANTQPGRHADAVAGGVRLYLADPSATEGREGGRAAEAMDGGVRMYLADTSAGVNYRDAVQGVSLYLAEAKSTPPDSAAAAVLLRDG